MVRRGKPLTAAEPRSAIATLTTNMLGGVLSARVLITERKTETIKHERFGNQYRA